MYLSQGIRNIGVGIVVLLFGGVDPVAVGAQDTAFSDFLPEFF
jgi:hypothetical protein